MGPELHRRPLDARRLIANLARGLTLTILIGLVGCYDEADEPQGFPHGGELRVWHIRLPDGSELRRLYGIFIADEEPADGMPPEGPATRPLPPQIGTCGPDVTAITGENPTYIDVGPSITFHFGDTDIEVERQVATEEDGPVIDFYGRQHQVAYLLETNEPITAGFFDATHSVTTAEPQDFSDLLDGLYVPPELDVLTPASIPTRLTRGEDFLVEWEPTEEPDPSMGTLVYIVISPFPAPNEPRITSTACVVENSGHFSIPAEVIDGLESDSGIMSVRAVSNQAVVRADGHQINMWGQNSTAVPWTRGD